MFSPGMEPVAKGGSPVGWGSALPGFWQGLAGILWRKAIAQADADTGLAQEWPRETDASAKEGQVGKSGTPQRPCPDGAQCIHPCCEPC